MDATSAPLNAGLDVLHHTHLLREILWDGDDEWQFGGAAMADSSQSNRVEDDPLRFIFAAITFRIGQSGRDSIDCPVKKFLHLSALLGLIWFCLPPVGLEAATLAGQQAQTGPLVEIRFPVSRYFQDMAAQGGNPRPETGRAVLSFPPGFDPARRWPILIVTSTTDYHRTSPMDAEWYHPPADAEGWVILASDATIRARQDTTPWRVAMLGAALDAMRKEWPQSAKWPVAFAGISGGAKRSCLLGSMLAKRRSVNICGFFLSGINNDLLSEAYKTYQPGVELLNVPIWISGGMDDLIATPSLEGAVEVSLRRTGFKRVRLERFMGGHWLKRSEVRLALRWFRELGGF